MIKGISTFDVSKGARLATYAARCVENEILMYFRSQRKSASDVSLSELIDTNKEGNDLSLIEVVSSEEDLFDRLSEKESCHRLHKAIQEHLTEREQTILIYRYGMYGQEPLPQRELAKKLGISRSYVSRIEKRAMEKLREILQNEAT